MRDEWSPIRAIGITLIIAAVILAATVAYSIYQVYSVR